MDRLNMGGRDFGSAQVSPLSTLVRGVIECMFPDSSWDDLHSLTAPQCKTRKLTIASVTTLMVQVVAGARRSLFAAFTADQAAPAPIITASYQAVYGRIGRMAPSSRALWFGNQHDAAVRYGP